MSAADDEEHEDSSRIAVAISPVLNLTGSLTYTRSEGLKVPQQRRKAQVA